MKKAIISTTTDDNYLFNLPFAVFSWNKIGYNVKCMCASDDYISPKFKLVREFCANMDVEFVTYECAEHLKPTYSQVSRLFGAIGENIDTVLITADVDMCVFDSKLFNQSPIIIGYDLADGQIPMCYTQMSAYKWKRIMNITDKDSVQSSLSFINDLPSNNVRGDYWSLDQELLTEAINSSGIYFNKVSRRNEGGTATNRADRDGWPRRFDNIIDAHLPRPLTAAINFEKVVDLFSAKYPDNEILWMHDYRNKYLAL